MSRNVQSPDPQSRLERALALPALAAAIGLTTLAPANAETVLARIDAWTVAREGTGLCYGYVNYPTGTRLVLQAEADGQNETWSVLIGEHGGRDDVTGNVLLKADNYVVFNGPSQIPRSGKGTKLTPVNTNAVTLIARSKVLTLSSPGQVQTYNVPGVSEVVPSIVGCINDAQRALAAASQPAPDTEQADASAPAPAAAPIDVTAPVFKIKDSIEGGFANMRSGPGVKNPIVAKIPEGTTGLRRTGPCRDRDDGLTQLPWCPIVFEGTEGFVSTFNLEVPAETGASIDVASPVFNIKDYVEGGFANMRDGPGVNHNIVAKIPAGTTDLPRSGPCRDRDDGLTELPWCPLVFNGVKGFVSAFNLVTPPSPVSQNTRPGAAVPPDTAPNRTNERNTEAAESSPRGNAKEPNKDGDAKERGLSTGTGFFVSSDGHLLTNAHVAAECRSLTAALPGSPSSPASLIAVDKTNDLALLRMKDARPLSIPQIVGDARMGSNIAVYGFPLTGALSTNGNFTTGLISATTGLMDNSSLQQITAPVQPGNSGGPVLDDHGNIVGVVVSKLNALAVASLMKDVPQNVNFAIKASVARTFLQAHSVPLPPTPAAATPTLSNPDLAEKARGFTVLITCSP